MNRKSITTRRVNIFAPLVVLGIVLTLLLGVTFPAFAQTTKNAYPTMAPLSQYLMADRNAEIALARSAGPASISRKATVLVLGRHGYETAIKGTNGFTCIVERGWTAGIDDVDFWNPKLRGPLCLNPPAVRSYLPLTIKKTELVLAGKSRTQMFAGLEEAFNKKELPALEPGAMCYMLSKGGYLADAAGPWHPHLMFFVSPSDDQIWGANLPGSPVVAADDAQDRLKIVMVKVAKWSDGTMDSSTAM